MFCNGIVCNWFHEGIGLAAMAAHVHPHQPLCFRGLWPPARLVGRCSQVKTVLSTTGCSVRCRASSKLEDVPLFANGGLVGSAAASSAARAPDSQWTLEDVPLKSKAGLDYTKLRDFLKAGDFQKADDETRQLLINLAGAEAVKRGWVYFTEVKFIAAEDLQTIDELWRKASDGKFGYSVQKELWVQCQQRWGKFFKQIDWTTGENNNYRKWPMEFVYTINAPKGHLPLTNALRGTQLLQAVLEHPAFVKKSSSSIDQRSKDAGKDTLKWSSL